MAIIYKLLLDVEQKAVTLRESEISSYPNTHLWGWANREDCPIFAPESVIRPAEEFDRNLNNRRKVQLESELALMGLKNNHLFRGTLHKLGHAVDDWLASHASDVPAFYDRAGRIFQRYYYTDKPYLGRKGSQSMAQHKRPASVYKESMRYLINGKDIPSILFGHMAVMRILNEVFKIRSGKLNQLRPDALFANRGRMKTCQDAHNSDHLSVVPGIEVEQPVTRGRVMPHSKAASRSQRKVLPDEFSSFVYEAYRREIPFIGGPSGSAAECLMFALFFSKYLSAGCLSEEELKIYTFCCMSYLISAGAHSFHEVAVIANLAGVPYKIGLYEDPLPDCFKATKDYQMLLGKYPDLIQPCHSPLMEDPVFQMENLDEAERPSSSCAFKKRKNMPADVCPNQYASFASSTKKQKTDAAGQDQEFIRGPFIPAGSCSSHFFPKKKRARQGRRCFLPGASGGVDVNQASSASVVTATLARKI